jgi:hypothetical protein
MRQLQLFSRQVNRESIHKEALDEYRTDWAILGQAS